MDEKIGIFDSRKNNKERIHLNKTNTGLVKYAKEQLGKPYWYGCFGQTATKILYEQKKTQYPKYYTAKDFTNQYNQKVHDCIGLIKGYLWSDSETSAPKYNPYQDVSADGMLYRCMEYGKIATLPEAPGILVFMDQHVGIYIGDGEVIEARGHEYGVVKTRLSDRPWTTWGKCPWIEYTQQVVASKENLVLSFQRAASADGFKFNSYGLDGKWGTETESVAQKCIVKRRLFYKYKHATVLVQRVLGIKQDGIAGKETENAIKEFQKRHGLVVDGCCGLNTWKKLLGIN